MLKHLLFCMACLAGTMKLNAQVFKFEESAPFEEPESGWLKILQMKNGNTALVHISYKEGVNIKIYDPSHKIKLDKIVRPKYVDKGELPEKNSAVAGVLNIGNDILLFATTIKDKAPVIIRVIIDGNTGLLKGEEVLGELQKIGFSDKYALAFGVPTPRFMVRKDPDSDNYGVALFNTLVSDRSKRIELIHYGADNKPLSRAFYSSPNEEFKYMELIDFAVLGDQKIIASAYIYNTGEDKVSYLSLASLEKGASSVKTKQLEFTVNKVFSAGIMRFNKKNNLIAIVGLDFIGFKKSKKYYNPILTLIDPATLGITFTKDIQLPNINSEYHKIFGDKKNYEAIPQDFYVNEDGTYTIVFEESGWRAMYSSNISHTTVTIKLGSIVVAVLDDKTKEISSSLIPKAQELNYTTYGSSPFTQYDYDPMYLSRRNESAQWLKDAIQYKSFAYANGKSGKFILFNDLVENTENIKKGKMNAINGVSGSDAYVCTLGGAPTKKEFLFGPPVGKAHNFTMVSVSDYDASTGTYITLKLENDHGKKLKVIWVKL